MPGLTRLILLATAGAVAAVAGCTTTVAGQGATPSPTAGSGTGKPAQLEFRKVEATEPATAGRGPAATATPGPADVDAAKAARQRLDTSDGAKTRSALDALDCSAPDPLRGNDDPNLPLVTCDRNAPAKYVLGPALLGGSDVANATASIDQTSGRWIVQLSFQAAGTKAWADFTAQNVGQQVAIVLDAEVVSAPEINQAILDGNTVISGNFTRADAERIVASLTHR